MFELGVLLWATFWQLCLSFSLQTQRGFYQRDFSRCEFLIFRYCQFLTWTFPLCVNSLLCDVFPSQRSRLFALLKDFAPPIVSSLPCCDGRLVSSNARIAKCGRNPCLPRHLMLCWTPHDLRIVPVIYLLSATIACAVLCANPRSIKLNLRERLNIALVVAANKGLRFRQMLITSLLSRGFAFKVRRVQVPQR